MIGFCLTITKSITKYGYPFLVAYFAIWLFAVTSVAAGCAINCGNTWCNTEVFGFFIIGNAEKALSLLGADLFSVFLLEKYLLKQS